MAGNIRMAAILYYGGELSEELKAQIKTTLHYEGGQDIQIVEFTPKELEEFRKYLNKISKVEKQEIEITEQEAHGIEALVELVAPVNGVLLDSASTLRYSLATAFGDAKRRNTLIEVLRALGNSSDKVCASSFAKKVGLTKKLMEVIREANGYYIPMFN